jgi:hypothetical protein
MLKVGQKVFSPAGQGIVTKIDDDGDVQVTRINADGNKVELLYDPSVVSPVPTAEDLAAQVSRTFQQIHPEFHVCTANAQILAQYISERNLPWTLPNLEEAFAAKKSQLALKASAPITAPVTPVAPKETTMATPTVPATPATTVPSLTKKEIAKWSGKEMREKMEDPAIRAAMRALASGRQW